MNVNEILTEELDALVEKTSVLDVLLVLAQVLEARNYSAEAALVAQAAEL